MSFIEISAFGWNATTFAFLATMIFSFYGATGLHHQIQQVRRGGTGSVSVMWTLSFLAMFITLLPYGLQTHKLAFVVTFFLRVPFYVRLLGLIYKDRGGLSRMEWAVTTGLVAILLGGMVSIPIVFLVLMWGGALIALDQPWKIWRYGRRAVSIRLLVAYAASSFFWLVYGFVLPDVFTISWAAVYCLVYGLGIVLFYWSPKQAATP